jgi:hypothetical protein
MLTTVSCDQCDLEKLDDVALMGWIRLEPMGLLRTMATPGELHFCSDVCAEHWLRETGLRAFRAQPE